MQYSRYSSYGRPPQLFVWHLQLSDDTYFTYLFSGNQLKPLGWFRFLFFSAFQKIALDLFIHWMETQLIRFKFQPAVRPTKNMQPLL